MDVALNYAQNKTLDRDLEPIIKSGNAFPLFDGFPINELFVFVYRASTDTWEQGVLSV